ncbi:DUF423 domain-containing protein [Thiomicrorhabdus xiamenensis]|uniref:DUF423 domain-containing protein n=1 Tax=Thiomicrorhabdus xiamenensis TaxID=2739063 RepID=A0A7D4NPI9_9GAMM|nr:DUF423 domain-containing protein [Thiomicrorhabdus xiamenensis]QKI88157.1 DUF423 domain-containing protein [Thiomicrorhabdus xiamenensis]
MTLNSERVSVWLQWSSFLLFLAVALGAFGAHGLQEHFSVKQLDVWHKAVNYQVIHAFALLAIAVLVHLFSEQSAFWTKAGWSFLTGIFLFSGSLYLWALSGLKFLVFLTPIGGMAFLLGWLLLFLGARDIRRST